MTTPSEDEFRSVMAELARNVWRPTPVDKALSAITSAAVQLVEGVDCADVLVITGYEFHSTAATSDVAPAIDEAQMRTGEGPCLDAANADLTVRCSDLNEDPRWPLFSGEAVRAGVHSVLSFQLFTHGSRRGAMNLFGFRPHDFTAQAETVSAMLASHAAVALIAADKQEQFESALASRDTIGQAKGMVMERFDLDAVRAFELLRKVSQDRNIPIHVLAGDIVNRGPDRWGDRT